MTTDPAGAMSWWRTLLHALRVLARTVVAVVLGVATADDRRGDALTAVTMFVLGWLLLEVGLVDIVRWEPLPFGAPEPWWRVALLAVGCALILVKRSRPMLALAGGIVVMAVDLAWGGSLAVVLVLWDLLYGAALWAGPRSRAWLWGTALTVTVVGSVVAGEAARDVRYFVYAALQLGAVLLVPMWWADNVRQKSELAELERARADEAARAAELERERAADLQRLSVAQRHEAVQAERAAMARDLHDVIASHLSTIAIHSGAALSTPPEAARDRAALAQVRESAVASLTEMRSMIELLRADAPRDPLAAPARLDRLTDLVDAARAAGVDVTVEDPRRVADDPLPAAVGQALHRIAQEALTNARKHAPGAGVHLCLGRDDDGPGAVTLRVANGPGRRASAPGDLRDAALSAGTGLLTMRERAEGLGGTFAAGPDDDGGWVVRARVPLEEERP
ncbi:histidine kinase [Isoptericola sp. 4D.3]|uniref:histidine kinase n=1 Tax=Isoptericola peretonis TaxID=2918523 RepID=A0ABT0J9D1_9MICO|nr:histidine kinase [Isoptericola sp. 4D.3]